MDPQAIEQLINRVAPALKTSGKFIATNGKKILAGMATFLTGIFVGDRIGSWRERKKFEKRLKAAIEKLSEESQKEITEIVRRNRKNLEELKSKVKEYLTKKGVDISDFPS